jgi:hypothetical protein
MKVARYRWSLFVPLLALIIVAQGASALEINGLVTGSSAGSFSIAQLQALQATTEVLGGDTFTGVSLWTLLGGNATGTTSNITTVGGGNNPILRNYVLASGGSGRSLLSVGEIDPFFGGTGLPYLIAYQKNGTTLATPLLVVPQDSTRTRYVSDLTNLSIGAVPAPPSGPRSTTTQFTLTGVSNPGTYTASTLAGLPQSTAFGVTFLAGTTPNGPHDYTGVSLWTLLTTAGIPGDLLTSYLLATGSDGFQVLFALAELDPAFGAALDLLATSVDGGPLGSNGFARTVIPGDLHGGRFVSNIASLAVAAIPAPATLLLFGSSMAGLALARWSRRRCGRG